MTGLWKTWITLWCWGIILFGVVLAAGGLPAADGVVRVLYGLLSSQPLPEGFLDAPGIRFSVALMGAVTMGWGITILFLLPAIHAAGAPAWRGLTAALGIWFVIDGLLSAATGFALNNVPNTALAIAYLVPVLASGALRATGR
jgi:pheromone shutdown protein TraB